VPSRRRRVAPPGPARVDQRIARKLGPLGQLEDPTHSITGLLFGAFGVRARQGSCWFSRRPCALARVPRDPSAEQAEPTSVTG
jgi:hypothetical protein